MSCAVVPSGGWLDDGDVQRVGDFVGLGHPQQLLVNSQPRASGKLMTVEFGHRVAAYRLTASEIVLVLRTVKQKMEDCSGGPSWRHTASIRAALLAAAAPPVGSCAYVREGAGAPVHHSQARGQTP